MVRGEVISGPCHPISAIAIILKSFAARRTDVSLLRDDDVTRARRKYCVLYAPRILLRRSVFDELDVAHTSLKVALPDISVRQGWNAQDPLARCYHGLFFM